MRARRAARPVATFSLVLLIVVGLALQACVQGQTAQVAAQPGTAGPQLPIEVLRPDGPGPFPAVVWLHSCAGLVRGANHVRDWTRRLVGMGYVVALPDSFSARGHPSGVCGYGMRVPPDVRAQDAYATVRHLESLPYVVADRIGVIGYSHGGWTVLAAMDQQTAAQAKPAAQAQHGFAAAIAFYPDCTTGGWIRVYRTTAPLLILAGNLDDWTPSAPCQLLADRTQRQGQPVSIKIYPEAHHSFDGYAPVRHVPEARQGRGATIGGNPAAREDSIRQVEVFFGQHLKGRSAAGS